MTRIEARIEIVVDEVEMADGEGDPAQLVQDIIGHTGAQVIDAEIIG